MAIWIGNARVFAEALRADADDVCVPCRAGIGPDLEAFFEHFPEANLARIANRDSHAAEFNYNFDDSSDHILFERSSRGAALGHGLFN